LETLPRRPLLSPLLSLLPPVNFLNARFRFIVVVLFVQGSQPRQLRLTPELTHQHLIIFNG
jgi:hypothetical protein